jgi:AhpD family alkylhydroperoxidase
MMLDWEGYLQEITATISRMAATSPDILRGYRIIGEAAKKTGKLDAKTRELIALGVAVTRQCDGCSTTHTSAAIKAGVTEDELIEALGVAVSVNAGAAIVYSARTLDAFAAKTKP